MGRCPFRSVRSNFESSRFRESRRQPPLLNKLNNSMQGSSYQFLDSRGRRCTAAKPRQLDGERLDWVATRLRLESDGKPSSSAPLFLAAIEGMYLLKAIGRGAVAGSAARELASRSR